jgi:hypothetical protein
MFDLFTLEDEEGEYKDVSARQPHTNYCHRSLLASTSSGIITAFYALDNVFICPCTKICLYIVKQIRLL